MRESEILMIVLSTAPTMITVLIGILINNSRLGDIRSEMKNRMNEMNTRIGELRTRMDQRFDGMRDMWRAELPRVEEVPDPRG